MSAVLLLAAVILFVAAAFFTAPTWAVPLGLALFAASFLVGPAQTFIQSRNR